MGYSMIVAVDYALLLGEIEGVYAKLKQLGTTEELAYVEAMKKKYYKEYFALLREERAAEQA
ncbi:hypothetical protein CC030809_00188 [Synechococcus phage S-CAM7]|uniref:Uncharacterized protein n=1 Tax=Synechococcus phage S-CAM7 TaxID=1883368 RepID=A0A7D5JS10_9CAUD|nr:hypothetical protein CC030809_00188 [Synechococcus phage S-CAM7]